MDYLKKVKTHIGLTDDLQDEQLKTIIENVEAELLSRIPKQPDDNIPSELDFIVIEVSSKRYNRIGAEGMTSESVDGRSNSFEANDFDAYDKIIDALFPVDTLERKGGIRFY